MDMQLDKFDTI